MWDLTKSSRIVGSPQVVVPGRAWTQEEIRQRLNIEHPTAIKMFASPHIRTRHLAYLSHGEPLMSFSEAQAYRGNYANGKVNENINNESIMVSTPERDLDSVLLAPELTIPREEKVQPNAKDRETLFDRAASEMATTAVQKALSNSNLDASQIDVLTAVTSTALPMPGLTARIVGAKVMTFRSNVQRMDVVGMGCNGGLSALRTLAMTLQQLALSRNTRVFGLLICCEVNSCMFLANDTPGDGIVNALFGDAAVAVILHANPLTVSLRSNCHHVQWSDSSRLPSTIVDTSVSSASSDSSLVEPTKPIIDLIDFESHTFTECFEDMKYVVDEKTQLNHFVLSKRIPFAMGSQAHIPVRALLARHNGLGSADIDHFVVHGGGRKVIEGLAEGLGIPNDEAAAKFRHTISVLRDYGNLSSGSFLVSLQRLYEELDCKKDKEQADRAPIELDINCFYVGQTVLFMAMGPGATVEVALGVVNDGTDVML